jgi:Xaa-Pro aminopeptidase
MELSESAVASRRNRLESVRGRMDELGVDALMLSLGADMPWLTGYVAMPLERLTVFVLRSDGEAVMVVPELEAPRVPVAGDLFELRAWSELEDPVAIACGVVGKRADRIGISDRAWASFLLGFEECLPEAKWIRASTVTSELRALKDEAELKCLRAASAAADRVAGELQAGDLPMVGRTEEEVSDDISARLISEGHEHVNFAIVGSGPNGASPHHDAGPRRIERGDVVVCDFGGSLALDGDVGYCSDITRTVTAGDPPDSEVARIYEVLRAAQQAGVEAVAPGVSAQSVDEAARRVIEEAGYGDRFIHRTGHGIGIEEHEDPYLVAGNRLPLVTGHAFSVEPGIYFPGRFGMRLEDIVVVGADGPDPLNTVDHSLVVLER